MTFPIVALSFAIIFWCYAWFRKKDNNGNYDWENDQ